MNDGSSITDDFTITKHSKRTIREVCKDCGTSNLYRAHMTTLESEDTYCADCNSSVGPLVIVDADTLTLHACGHELSQLVKASEYAGAGAGTGASEAELQALRAKLAGDSAPAPAPVAGDPAAMATAMQALAAAFAPQMDRDQIAGIVREIVADIVMPERVILRRDDVVVGEKLGGHKQLAQLVSMVQPLANGKRMHVWAHGPAGCGKSTMAKDAAEVMGLTFYPQSFSAFSTKGDLEGFMSIADGKYHPSPFREAFENGGVYLADEFDACNPAVAVVLNMALANRMHRFPDGTLVNAHEDFVCVAGANTVGKGANRSYGARAGQDAATLDRFVFLAVVRDDAVEKAMCEQAAGGRVGADQIERVLTLVGRIRDKAAASGMDVVCSPRASEAAIGLMHNGLSFADAVDSAIRKGMGDHEWNKLSA